jgi:hypothetical protein
MRSIPAISRVLVALALIISLGSAGISPCNRRDEQQAMHKTCEHGSHSCKCIFKTGECSCSSQCQCGSPPPNQDDQPALPSRAEESSRLIAVVPRMVIFGDLIDLKTSSIRSHPCLAIIAKSLISQGTRLNV